MCPYQSEEARRLWNKACNKCRGIDLHHVCGNPFACKRRFDEANNAEYAGSSPLGRWN